MKLERHTNSEKGEEQGRKQHCLLGTQHSRHLDTWIPSGNVSNRTTTYAKCHQWRRELTTYPPGRLPEKHCVKGWQRENGQILDGRYDNDLSRLHTYIDCSTLTCFGYVCMRKAHLSGASPERSMCQRWFLHITTRSLHRPMPERWERRHKDEVLRLQSAETNGARTSMEVNSNFPMYISTAKNANSPSNSSKSHSQFCGPVVVL